MLAFQHRQQFRSYPDKRKSAVNSRWSEFLQGLVAMCKKLLEKTPLKYPLVRNMTCLDPRNMFHKPDRCINQMKKLTHNLLHAEILKGGLVAGEHVCQEVQDFVHTEARSEGFKTFNPNESRLEVFLIQYLGKHTHLEEVVRNLLLLSHGKASVERGFSVNKEVLKDNQEPSTVIA